MTRRVFTVAARAAIALGLAGAAAAFVARETTPFVVAIGVVLAGAALSMILESTAPDPKDAPGPALPEVEDRKRWNEAPLEAPWPEHELCTDCSGAKLCPKCGGKGGCDACARLSWCAECGGAGQWPRDQRRPIYTPAPARRRVT